MENNGPHEDRVRSEAGFFIRHLPDEAGSVVDSAHVLLGETLLSDDPLGLRSGRKTRDYVVEYPMPIASYEMNIDSMIIHDPVWGECEIGNERYDALLLELAETPLFRRLQAVEQLTFSGDFSTLPNTSGFSRWQHVWGSLAFVRKMTENDDRFDERQRIVLQLRTLFSDVGQTAFSHLGDWLSQGLDGGEDQHDQELKVLLETFGIEKKLANYGLTLDEAVFPDIEDWVERPSPNLCVDRVDYGLREILRWACPPSKVNMYKNELENPKSLFEITDDGQLVIINTRFAREFALGFSLLPSEDWSHPTHRVMMELMQTAVRDDLVSKTDYSGLHPRDLMYGIDYDFDDYFLKWGGAAIGDIMKHIALEQRRIFTVARQPELDQFFAGFHVDNAPFPDFPDPIRCYSWKTKEFGKKPLPSQLSVKEKDITEPYMKATKKGLQIGLPRLKSRRVDPLVKTEDGNIRLTELDPSYGRYLEQQYDMMNRSFRATIHMRKDVAKMLVKRHEEALRGWEKAIRRKRNPNFMKKVVAGTAFSLLGAAHRFDRFSPSHAYKERLDEQAVSGIGYWSYVQLKLD